jgi:hypothetical protein
MNSQCRIDRFRDRMGRTSLAAAAACAAVALIASGAHARPTTDHAARAGRSAAISVEPARDTARRTCDIGRQGASRALREQSSQVVICRLAAAVEVSIRGNPAIF